MGSMILIQLDYIHARRLAGLIVAPEYSEAKLGLIHGQAKAA